MRDEIIKKDILGKKLEELENKYNYKLNCRVVEEESIGDTYEVYILPYRNEYNQLIDWDIIIGESDTILGAMNEFDNKLGNYLTESKKN